MHYLKVFHSRSPNAIKLCKQIFVSLSRNVRSRLVKLFFLYKQLILPGCVPTLLCKVLLTKLDANLRYLLRLSTIKHRLYTKIASNWGQLNDLAQVNMFGHQQKLRMQFNNDSDIHDPCLLSAINQH